MKCTPALHSLMELFISQDYDLQRAYLNPTLPCGGRNLKTSKVVFPSSTLSSGCCSRVKIPISSCRYIQWLCNLKKVFGSQPPGKPTPTLQINSLAVWFTNPKISSGWTASWPHILQRSNSSFPNQISSCGTIPQPYYIGWSPVVCILLLICRT